MRQHNAIDKSSRKSCVIVLLFPLLFTSLLIVINCKTSENRTEIGLIGAAIYFYKTLRFDIFQVNLPLNRYFIALPIHCMCLKQDWTSYSPCRLDRAEWNIGVDFIKANTENSIHKLFFWSRCSLLPFILIGVYYGRRLVVECYRGSGYIFLLCIVFSPLILGWGATICPDVLGTMLGLVGIYTYWRWLKAPDVLIAMATGLALGLMLLTKLTWLVAFPLYMILLIIWYLPIQPKSLTKQSNTKLFSENQHLHITTKHVFLTKHAPQLVLIFFVGICVVNTGYFFGGSFTQLRNYQFVSNELTGNSDCHNHQWPYSGNRFTESVVCFMPLPFPKDFVYGIDTQKFDFEVGKESFLNGSFSSRGWKSYYFWVLLYKEPLGFLGLLLLAVGLSLFGKGYNTQWRDEMVPIVSFIVIFGFVSYQDGISMHPRYILPAMPFMYIFTSKVGKVFEQSWKTTFEKFQIISLRLVVLILLGWAMTSSMLQYSHSMSYFNEIIGQTDGGKYLQGSNVDWGQNNLFFQEWCNTNSDKVVLSSYLPPSSLCRLNITNIRYYDEHEKKSILYPSHAGWYTIGTYDLYGKAGGLQSLNYLKPRAVTAWAGDHFIKSAAARSIGSRSGMRRRVEIAALVKAAKTVARPARVSQWRSSSHQRSFTKCREFSICQ